MPRIIINVNFVDSGTAAANAANTINTVINEKQENFELVNSYGQIVASIMSSIPILKPVTLQANTFAATASFLQLHIHIEDGAPVNTIASDVLNIVGNVSGVVATGAILAGAAPGLIMGATVVAIGATVANLLISAGAIDKLQDWSVAIIDTWAPPEGIPVTTGNLYMDTSGWFREYDDIEADPQAEQGGIVINHSDWEAAGAYFWDENAAPPPTEVPPGNDDPWLNPQYIPMPVQAAE